jgi:hypothetical protein
MYIHLFFSSRWWYRHDDMIHDPYAGSLMRLYLLVASPWIPSPPGPSRCSIVLVLIYLLNASPTGLQEAALGEGGHGTQALKPPIPLPSYTYMATARELMYIHTWVQSIKIRSTSRQGKNGFASTRNSLLPYCDSIPCAFWLASSVRIPNEMELVLRRVLSSFARVSLLALGLYRKRLN